MSKFRKIVALDIIPFVKMCFYNTVCKLWIVLFGSSDKRNLKYHISICMIFKNESPFLKEWLDFHLTIGIDHFYLYNNNSDDDYKEVLAPYISNGSVTLIDYPYKHAQIQAYKHFYENFRNETNWVSFIDADEFICPKYELTIAEWLKKYEKYPAVTIHWLIFGTSGRMSHDYSKGVLEQYYVCWEDLYKHGKCIINTRFDIANFDTWYVYHHFYMYIRVFGIKFAVPAVNQFGYICTIDKVWGGGSNKRNNSSIQINHYITKSWDIWSKRMKGTDAHYEKNPRKEFSYYNSFDMNSISSDFTIQRFLMKMRRMQGILDGK